MGTNKYFKIDVKIRDYFLSNNTAIVFTRLVYWSSKKPNGFYKFKQACKKHPLYKKGDSWGEELGMSRKILDPILSRLVNHHKTKKAYDQAQDKFNGKMFASYTNHKTSQTFYFVDRKALDKFLKETTTVPPSSSKEDSNAPKASKNMAKNHSSDVPEDHHLACAHQNHSCIQTITSLDEEKLISKEMIGIWNSHMDDNVIWYPSYVQRLCSVLKDFFNNCLKTFKQYCLGISSVEFLAGKARNSNFKAFFFWAIKHQTIQDIFAGAYGVKNFFALPSSEERKLQADIRDLHSQLQSTKYLIQKHQDEIIEGQRKLVYELKQSLTDCERHTLRKQSDEEFYQKNPQHAGINDRFSKMVLDAYFEGRDGYLNKTLRNRLGLEDTIVTPQELLDRKNSLISELNRADQMLQTHRKQRTMMKMDYNCV